MSLKIYEVFTLHFPKLLTDVAQNKHSARLSVHCPVVRTGFPTPHPQASVAPPPLRVQGGRHACLRVGYQFQQRDIHSGTLRDVLYYPSHLRPRKKCKLRVYGLFAELTTFTENFLSYLTTNAFCRLKTELSTMFSTDSIDQASVAVTHTLCIRVSQCHVVYILADQ
jgi:hypothetical protein